jgi:hypothetical protein
MPHLPFTYCLVAIGVNRTPGGTTLSSAEGDAVNIACAQAGQLGPVLPENAQVLLGAAATCAAVDRALLAVARRRPTFFSFYFGGHGNAAGLGLADGLYSFARLHRMLKRIAARGTVVILNSCGAGGFAKSAALGGVDVGISAPWTAALLSAVPGSRVFMASSADAYTLESPDVGGVFAHALLNAMQAPASGDLHVAGHEFVSDRLVFVRATKIMATYGLKPQSMGMFGDFPMVLANAHPVGAVSVESAEPTNGVGLEVVIDVRNRRYLSTAIVATARDAQGNRWPPKRVVGVPDGARRKFTASFDVDVRHSPASLAQLSRYGACRISWDIDVVDANGRLLARDRRVADYVA